MPTDHADDLDSWSKGDLVARAEALGIVGAAKFTKLELVDEIRRVEGASDRGLLGKARDLLRGVVEKGLARALGNEPPKAGAPAIGRDPAAADEVDAEARPEPPPGPLASRTLAEIHLAQGDRTRAREILEAVLRAHPDDAEARAMLDVLDRRAAREGQVVASESTPGATQGPAGAQALFAVRREAATEAPEAAPAEVDLDALREASAAPPSEPAAQPAPEPAVPARYDVDECVAMPVDARTLYVYWETRPATVARARKALGPDAQPSLRVLVVEPAVQGPAVSTRDVPIPDASLAAGETFVRDLPPAAILRAAIGLRAGARFLPIAHTTDVEAPPEAPSPVAAHEVRAWAPFSVASPRAAGEPSPPERVPSRPIAEAQLPVPLPEARPDFADPASFDEAVVGHSVELPPEILGRGLSSAELAEQRLRIRMGAGAPPGDVTRRGAGPAEGAKGGASELWAAAGSSAWGAQGPSRLRRSP